MPAPARSPGLAELLPLDLSARADVPIVREIWRRDGGGGRLLLGRTIEVEGEFYAYRGDELVGIYDDRFSAARAL